MPTIVMFSHETQKVTDWTLGYRGQPVSWIEGTAMVGILHDCDSVQRDIRKAIESNKFTTNPCGLELSGQNRQVLGMDLIRERYIVFADEDDEVYIALYQVKYQADTEQRDAAEQRELDRDRDFVRYGGI